jgi:hypothetical protein
MNTYRKFYCKKNTLVKYAEISKILGDCRMRSNDNVMLLTTISAGAYYFLA